MKNVVRLAIVDPNDASRATLKSLMMGMDMVWLEAECSRYDFFADVVTQTQPDIVFVGLGFPKQEHLIEKLRPLMPNAWWVGVGISFSFVSGRVSRAPRPLQALGLEWTHRFVQEPRRLAKRYFVHDLPFAFELLTAALLTRARSAR